MYTPKENSALIKSSPFFKKIDGHFDNLLKQMANLKNDESQKGNNKFRAIDRIIGSLSACYMVQAITAEEKLNRATTMLKVLNNALEKDSEALFALRNNYQKNAHACKQFAFATAGTGAAAVATANPIAAAAGGAAGYWMGTPAKDAQLPKTVKIIHKMQQDLRAIIDILSPFAKQDNDQDEEDVAMENILNKYY